LQTFLKNETRAFFINLGRFVSNFVRKGAEFGKLPCAGARTFSLLHPLMTAYKNAQHHVVLKGRDFHFVSYDGTPANEKRGIEETGPMWYLMGPNKRWPVMPHNLDQPDHEVLGELKKWIMGQGL
jgi:hypothetical protein